MLCLGMFTSDTTVTICTKLRDIQEKVGLTDSGHLPPANTA